MSMCQQGVRSEVSAASIAPEFANRVFVLKLPGGTNGRLGLTCQLFSVLSQGRYFVHSHTLLVFVTLCNMLSHKVTSQAVTGCHD